MDPLIVYNLSNSQIVILGTAIAANSQYSVPTTNILNWSKNAHLRVLCRGRDCYISVYGTPLYDNEATKWLENISNGSIVYDL